MMDRRDAARYYGLRDDPTLTKDQTASLQDFLDGTLDAAGGGGKAMLPPWRLAFTQLKVGPGLDLEGCGIGPRYDPGRGTFLQQLPGTNADAVINDPARTRSGGWMHWVRLANFRLEGNLSTGDTLGSGIRYTTGLGEGCVIERVFVKNFPDHGIWLADGAVPLKLRDLHLFQNGRYGLVLGADTPKQWSTCLVETVSGDDNGVGLIHLKKIQKLYAAVCLMHIKGEGHTTKQNDLIHIEDCACPVSVHVPSLSGIIPRTVVKSMVTITGPSTPRLSLFGPTGNGIDYLINDMQNGTTIPAGETAQCIALFYRDGLLQRWG